MSGEVLCEEEIVPVLSSEWIARGSIPASFLTPRDPTRAMLVADFAELRATHWFVHDLAIAYERPEFRVTADGDDAYRLASSTVVRDLCCCTDLLGGATKLRALEGMLTVLPGEAARIAFTGGALPSEEDVIACVRCANNMGR